MTAENGHTAALSPTGRTAESRLRLKKQKPFSRGHGLLMPVFSLDSEYGIGTLGKPARRLLDFIARAGGAMWQVLPLGPTGYGNSPYQCFSAFAGNPYLIDPENLYERGLLTGEELAAFRQPNTGRVDYSFLYQTRKKLLFPAFRRFEQCASSEDKTGFEAFCSLSADWLPDYAAFSAIKEQQGMRGREDFSEFCLKSDRAVRYAGQALSESMHFTTFLEYIFFDQWQALKAYATEKGILMVGDMPLYVSSDSADVWANPDLFELDEAGRPTGVAGVPPDPFSADGQLWGNPLYRWNAHRESGYDWWSRRVGWQAKLFDVIRIDHFIGLCRYYRIAAGETTARNGKWMIGPGRGLIAALTQAAGAARFIAEDLGAVTREVRRLMEVAGFPGMRLLQFAFDGTDNPNLPHRIPQNAVVYPGTHDNQTLAGFFADCPGSVRRNALSYLDIHRSRDLPRAVIRECFKCPADTAIIPMADYLGLDDAARINTPATLGGNWSWRMTDPPTDELAEKIAALAAIYKRER